MPESARNLALIMRLYKNITAIYQDVCSMNLAIPTGDLLSGPQVIEEFPVLTLRHLRSLRTAGVLPYYSIRHATYYSRADVEAYLRSRRAVGPQRGYQRTASR